MVNIWNINCINTGCNGLTTATSFEISLWLYHAITEIASSQNILAWNLCLLIYVKISNLSYLEAKKAYLREVSLLLLVEFVLLTSTWKYSYHMPSNLLIQISLPNRNVINMPYEIS